MVSRADIVAAARAWKGVKWQHQGRTRNGVDCVGLPIVVARDLGLPHEDRVGYARRPADDDRLVWELAEQMDRISVRMAGPGDLVVTRSRRLPTHVGILAERDGKRTIVHAYAEGRKVSEDWVEQGGVVERIVAAFRFRGLSDG